MAGMLRRVAGGTAQTTYHMLRGAFQVAVDQDAVVKHPMRGLKPPQSERRELLPPSRREVDDLLEPLPGNVTRPAPQPSRSWRTRV